MGTINESLVFTQAWDKIFSTLNGISDPAGKSKWIYSTYPETPVTGNISYPIIVVSPIDLIYNPTTFTNVKTGPLRVTVDIYSTSAQQLDSISDQIIDKFETSESSFNASGIHVMRLIGTDYGYFTRNSTRVHNKRITYEFDFWWF